MFHNNRTTTTTTKKEIDLEQAQELSKHIVSDIINQAVRRLNDDIKNNKHLKRKLFVVGFLFEFYFVEQKQFFKTEIPVKIIIKLKYFFN